MNIAPSTTSRSLLNRLAARSTEFSDAAAREKSELLELLARRQIHSAPMLKRLHDVLLYLQAFPDNAAVRRASTAGLAAFGGRIAALTRAQRERLDDSGIVGTAVYYEYSFESARWLSGRFGEAVEIDWPRFTSPERLDPLLLNIITPAEQQTFDEAEIGTEEWIRMAKGAATGSDLNWLLRHCAGGGVPARIWGQLYDAAEVPLVWDLGAGRGARTRNRYAAGRSGYRRRGMRILEGSAGALIARPLRAITHLDARRAQSVLDVVRAALLARHREVYAMQHANPREVYLADVGRGVQIAVLGVVPERRLSLETNYGYTLFSNGVPIGYGGVTPLFHQNNTGINIFSEFRRSEAAFLYAQVLRMAHTLFGSNRFVVNPYQFGADNPEALASGAFWFYYRLGFRPVEPEVRRLAADARAKIRKRRAYRTPAEVLVELASCDLHLELPGARAGQYFDESWLGIIAAAVTRSLAEGAPGQRRRGLRGSVRELSRTLGIDDIDAWSASQRTAFEHLVPVVSLIDDLESWPLGARRKLGALMRAKGGHAERDFAVRLRAHDQFRSALADFCKRSLGHARRG